MYEYFCVCLKVHVYLSQDEVLLYLCISWNCISSPRGPPNNGVNAVYNVNDDISWKAVPLNKVHVTKLSSTFVRSLKTLSLLRECL